MATASDGTHLKTHTVTEVQITAVDAAKDTVQGTAAPGSTIAIAVRTGETVEPGRDVTAGVDGTWVVDFSVPAGAKPRDVTHDLVAGESVSARQSDDDGDMTQDDLVVPSPEAGAPPVAFREPGPLVPTLTTYIPTPADVSTDPRSWGPTSLLRPS